MKSGAPSTHKKIVVETFDNRSLRGYLNPRRFDRPEGFEFLDPGGQRQQLAWNEVKIAWYVRDWEDPPPRPERLVFLRRPRLEGLWIRLRFRDQEVMEGLVVNDLLLSSEQGYVITPPDLNGQAQKAFVPRAALAAFEVLAVIPNRGAHMRRRRPPEPGRQRPLFAE